MVDICMCSWKECPIGSNCYRLQAIPDDYLQVYADFKIDFNPKTERCKSMILLKTKGKGNGNKEKKAES